MSCTVRSDVNVPARRASPACPSTLSPTERTASPNPASKCDDAHVWALESCEQLPLASGRGLRFVAALRSSSETAADTNAADPVERVATERRDGLARWRLLRHLFSHYESGAFSLPSRPQSPPFVSPTQPHSIRFFTFAMPVVWPTVPCRASPSSSSPSPTPENSMGSLLPDSSAAQKERLGELLRWVPPLQRHIRARCHARQQRRQGKSRKSQSPMNGNGSAESGVEEESSDAAWTESKVVAALAHALSNLADVLAPLSTAESPLAIAVTVATVVPVDATTTPTTAAVPETGVESCDLNSPALAAATLAADLHIQCTLLDDDKADNEGRTSALAHAWTETVKTLAGSSSPSANAAHRASSVSSSTSVAATAPETVLSARLRHYAEAAEAHLPIFSGTTVKVHPAPRCSLADVTVSQFDSHGQSSSSLAGAAAEASDLIGSLSMMDPLAGSPTASQRPRRSLRLATLNAVASQDAPVLLPLQAYVSTCLALIAELTDFSRLYSSPSAPCSDARAVPYRDSELAYLVELLAFYATAATQAQVQTDGHVDSARDRADTEAGITAWLRAHLVGTCTAAAAPPSPALAPLYAPLFTASPLSFPALLANWQHWLVLRVVSATVDWTTLWMNASVRALLPRAGASPASLGSPVPPSFLSSSSEYRPFRVVDVCHEQFRFEAAPAHQASSSSFSSSPPSAMNGAITSPRSTEADTVNNNNNNNGTTGGDDGVPDLFRLTPRMWCRAVQTARLAGSPLEPLLSADVRRPTNPDCGVTDESGGAELARRLWEVTATAFPALSRSSRALLHFFEFLHARVTPSSSSSSSLSYPPWYLAMRRDVVAPEESSAFHGSPFTCTVTFRDPALGPAPFPSSGPARGECDSLLANAAVKPAESASTEELSCDVSEPTSETTSPTALTHKGELSSPWVATAEAETHIASVLPVLCQWSYRAFLKIFRSILLCHVNNDRVGQHEGDHEAGGGEATLHGELEDRAAQAAHIKSSLSAGDRLRLPLVRCLAICMNAHVPFLVAPDPINAAFVAEAQTAPPSVIISVASGEVLVLHVSVLTALLTCVQQSASRLVARSVVTLQSCLRAESSRRWHTAPLRRAEGLARLTVIESFARAALSAKRVRDVHAAQVHKARDAVAAAAHPSSSSPSLSPTIPAQLDVEALQLVAGATPPRVAWTERNRPRLSVSPVATPASPSQAPHTPPLRARSVAPVFRTLQQLESEGRYWITQEVHLVWQEFFIGWEQLQRVGLCADEASRAAAIERDRRTVLQAAVAKKVASMRLPALDVRSSTFAGLSTDDELGTPELLRHMRHVARYGASPSSSCSRQPELDHSSNENSKDSSSRSSAHIVRHPYPPRAADSVTFSADGVDAAASPVAAEDLSRASSQQQVEGDVKEVEALLLMERAGRAELTRRATDTFLILAHHYGSRLQLLALESAEESARARLTAVAALCFDELQRRWCVVVLPCATAFELLKEKERSAAAASGALARSNEGASSYHTEVVVLPAMQKRTSMRQRPRGTTLFECPADLAAKAAAASRGVLRASEFALSTPGPSIMVRTRSHSRPRDASPESQAPQNTQQHLPTIPASAPPPPRVIPVHAMSLKDDGEDASPLPRVSTAPAIRKLMPSTLRHAITVTPSVPLDSTLTGPVGSDEYKRLQLALQSSPDDVHPQPRTAQTTSVSAAVPDPCEFAESDHTVEPTPSLSGALLDDSRSRELRHIGRRTALGLPRRRVGSGEGGGVGDALEGSLRGQSSLMPDWSAVPRRRQGRASFVTWTDTVVETTW